MSRFQHLEFWRRREPEAHEQAVKTVNYGGRRGGMITREDVETGFFSASVASLTMLAMLARGEPVESVVYLGGLAACVVPAYVYGTRVLGRSAPETARAILEFRAALAGGLVQVAAPGRTAPTDAAPPDITREQRWRAQLRRFMLVARMCKSFSIQTLAYDRVEHGVVTRKRFMTDKTWRVLRGALVDNHFLENGPKGTEYAPGKDYNSVVRLIQCGPLTLPDREPPEVDL